MSEASGGVDGLLLGDAVGVAGHAFYEVDGRDKKTDGGRKERWRIRYLLFGLPW